MERRSADACRRRARGAGAAALVVVLILAPGPRARADVAEDARAATRMHDFDRAASLWRALAEH